jgi:hypothetical protein
MGRRDGCPITDGEVRGRIVVGLIRADAKPRIRCRFARDVPRGPPGDGQEQDPPFRWGITLFIEVRVGRRRGFSLK